VLGIAIMAGPALAKRSPAPSVAATQNRGD